MSSSIAAPFLFVNLGCEYIFLLENRLKADRSTPRRKMDEVLVDCAFALFEENIMAQAFKKQRLYAAKEVRKVFYLVGQSPSLRIDDDSVDKMFTIICMIVKAHLLRLRTPDDMFAYVEQHLNEIRRSLDSTSLGEEVCDIIEETRRRFNEWYADMGLGEFQRMRASLLSFFSATRAPVSVLINAKVQHESGYLVAPTSGEPVERIGLAKVYDREGAVTRQYMLPVAGKNLTDVEFNVGLNLYTVQRIQQQKPEQEHAKEKEVSLVGATLSQQFGAATQLPVQTKTVRAFSTPESNAKILPTASAPEATKKAVQSFSPLQSYTKPAQTFSSPGTTAKQTFSSPGSTAKQTFSSPGSTAKQTFTALESLPSTLQTFSPFESLTKAVPEDGVPESIRTKPSPRLQPPITLLEKATGSPRRAPVMEMRHREDDDVEMQQLLDSFKI